MENMFEGNLKKYSPLSDRMRANTLGDFVGQEHLIYRNSFLVRAIENGVVGSCIFWGPPGCGKTTIANIIANTCNGVFKKLNAVSSGVGDAKAIIEEAKSSLELYGTKTYLLLDECHRWSKAQSDCVLEAIEKGYLFVEGDSPREFWENMMSGIAIKYE